MQAYWARPSDVNQKSELHDIHRGWSRWRRLDSQQAREIPTQDQIQLLRIQMRVFDDLPELEAERQRWMIRPV